MTAWRKSARFPAVLGLVLTIAPAVLVWTGRMSWSRHAALMLAGMVLWFVFAPLGWPGRRSGG